MISVCRSSELALFVAISVSKKGNRLMTSLDGFKWKGRKSVENSNWADVYWLSELSLFVVTTNKKDKVMTSIDGITWISSLTVPEIPKDPEPEIPEDKFEVLVICSTGNEESDMFYKNKFINYDIKNDLTNIDKYKNLLIIGNLIDIPESFDINISWIITEKLDQEKINNGDYDVVDMFFNKNEEEDELVKRYKKINVEFHEEVFFRKRLSSPLYLEESVKKDIESEIYSKILKIINSKNNRDVIKLKKDKNIFSLLKRNILTDDLSEKIDEEILFIISGDKEKISDPIYKDISRDSDIITRIELVIKHFYANYKTNNISADVKIINKIFLNYNKSGWKKIIPYFEMLESDSPIIIDTYIEKSFIERDTIYDSDWVGVIHNTKEYSISNLLDNTKFVESLNYCKNIVVFTEYTKNNVIKEMNEKSITFDKIKVLPHPVDFDKPAFSYEKFSKNPKKVIQIGEWINFFGIYRLETYISKFTDRYNDFNDKVIDDINVVSDYVNERVKGVKVIDIKNEKLEKSILFLNLFDVSEVNIINECIVRNIPVLVNKLNCVVELLGEDYPFYYETFCGATMKIDNIKIIEKTYNYLVRLDKEKYKPESFIKEFKKLL